MPQLDILGHQIKSPLPGMGYILLSHWSFPEKSQAIAKAIG